MNSLDSSVTDAVGRQLEELRAADLEVYRIELEVDGGPGVCKAAFGYTNPDGDLWVLRASINDLGRVLDAHATEDDTIESR